MKKLTFLTVALLSMNVAFAQTNPTAVNAKEMTQTKVSAAHEDKSKADYHDQSVAGVAKSADATAKSELAGAGPARKAEASNIADGKRADQKSKKTSPLAQQADASAAARAKASKEESNRTTDRTEVEVNSQVGKAETHGAAVAAVAQGTPAQGQEVKEVATANQKETPAKVEVEESAAEAAKVKPAVRRGGASRAAGAARAAGAVHARERGAAARGAASGATKPAKVNTNGASARPVQVGGAVKVKNSVKLRN